jgi:hypothetical protein
MDGGMAGDEAPRRSADEASMRCCIGAAGQQRGDAAAWRRTDRAPSL